MVLMVVVAVVPVVTMVVMTVCAAAAANDRHQCDGGQSVKNYLFHHQYFIDTTFLARNGFVKRLIHKQAGIF
jgi:hypothetical protein